MCLRIFSAVKDISSDRVKLPPMTAEMKMQSCVENYLVLIDPQPELNLLAVVHCSFYLCFFAPNKNKMIKISLSMLFLPIQRKVHYVRLPEDMVQLSIK